MTSVPPAIEPHALRAHYTRFLRPGRVLLTGHSHQAWPDVAREAMLEAWDDAAGAVDEKWGRAFEKATIVRQAVAGELGANENEIALAPNTHDLVLRFLSAIDLEARPHLVTTTGEFHTITRQLRRLSDRLDVTFIEALPAETLSERLVAALRPDTAAVLVSSVLFATATLVPHLGELVAAADAQGTRVLVDVYHQFMALPCPLPHPRAFVVGGGYKYAQWGEGACFLRVPGDLALTPRVTGWFAAFGALAEGAGATGPEVPYGPSPREAFAGSTYDPASHYRAAKVIGFFAEQGLTSERLRESSAARTGELYAGLEELGLDVVTPREAERRGGFVAVRMGRAGRVVDALKALGVQVDARFDLVRFGPAPYTTPEEIAEALGSLATVLTRLS